MRHLTVRSPALVFIAILLMTVGALTVPALAKNCGDGVAECACGDTVTADTTLDASDTVVFPDSVNGANDEPCPGIGLILAPGVALNLNALTIQGQGGGDGLVLGNGADVSGGRIRGFVNGIFAANTTGSVVDHVQVRFNTDDGIDIRGNGNTVEKCVVTQNAEYGVSVSGNANTVHSCRIELNRNGVFAGGGAGNKITRSVIKRNSNDGAQVSGTLATVALNRMEDNEGDGLEISGSGHTVSRLVNLRNGEDGMEVSASDSDFDRNRNSFNGGFGIRDTNTGTPNSYTNNICDGNALGDSEPPNLCR